MRTGHANVRDIFAEGCRLTAGVYLSEDQQAMHALLRVRSSMPLGELTRGRRVFRGPIFKRMFAADSAHGRPYVSAKDIVQADIRPAGYLSERHGALLDELTLHEGMILVTCSGMNLGRAVWTRADMEGLCASHDLIRIEPDPAKIPPGYLYAFLASRYGRVAIRRQIFGGSIKHVEPDHVARIAVPRISPGVEARANELICLGASARCRANRLRREVISQVHQSIGWSDIATDLVREVSSTGLSSRMDAFYHSAQSHRARTTLRECPESAPIYAVTRAVFEPPRGRRIRVDSPRRGVPFLSSSEVFRCDPEGDYLISLNTPEIEKLLVSECDLLIPRSGQIDGLIGRAVLPLPTYYGHAASEHLVRIRCHDRADALYLWAILASEPGYQALVATAFGSSIPSLDCGLISQIAVPWWRGDLRDACTNRISDALSELNSAILSEREALALVEKAIEEGG